MKRNSLPFGLLFVFILATCFATITHAITNTIVPGETKTGNIAIAGQSDSHSFSANSGDAVTILMGRSSGSLYPAIELHAPDGTVVKTASGYPSAAIQAQKVSQMGTYYIICRDLDGNDTGQYGVSLIKNPGSPNSAQDPDGGVIESGETKTGTIGVGDLDAFTFSGNSGDAVTILMGRSSGSLYPAIELHAPDGTVVKTASGYPSAAIQAQKVSQMGTYYIICRDLDGNDTGQYGVSLIKNPGSPNSAQDPDGGVIESGETKTGTIGVGDLDAFTFSANSGDAVTILMGRSSGSLYPAIELHAPDGTVVKTASGYPSAAIQAQKVSQMGTYYIICRDLDGNDTGQYGVSLIKNPGSPNSAQDPDGGVIESGETKTGTIGVGDLDAFTFSANSGDAVTILMGRSSGSLYPAIELHAPDGTVVKTASGYPSAAIQAQKVSQTGTYYIICRDLDGNDTGQYGVSFTIIETSPESISTPTTPSGPTSGIVGTSYTYTTGGSVSSLGHSVRYLFEWGDGSNSGWVSVGTTIASHSWNSVGTYIIKSQAQCATDTNVISSWSGSISITISSTSPIKYTLNTSVNPTGAGVLTLNPPGGIYNAGAVVTLTATANSGYTFTSWSGLGVGDTSNGSTASIPMNNNKTITANFTTISKDKAIVVAGGGPYKGNHLWEATEMNANRAYRVLTYQGYANETVYYLCSNKILDLDNDGIPDVDADATNSNLQYAITQWAKDAESLVVYLTGHGGNGTFRMSETEVLKDEDLASWLNELQQTMEGLVTVIYDACESGSFISKLAPPSGKQRITITSTSPGEHAYFLSQGTLSFSYTFWSQILGGAKIYDAYAMAKDGIGVVRGTEKDQNPQIDDNGNGIGNEKTDGDLARNKYIGKGLTIASDIPIIGIISQDHTLNGQTSATITGGDIVSTNIITWVWAIVYSPDFTNPSDNPVTNLPSFDLTWNDQTKRYEGTYDGFTMIGTYTVMVYAMNEEMIVSLPKTTRITQTVGKSNRCDFNGDGKTDILWRNKSTGQNVVWFMNGTTYSSYAELVQVSDTNWEIVGTDDFNGDGKTDILWRNKSTGQNIVWLMNGTTYNSYSELMQVPDTNWQIVGMGDFNGDGKTDILWRNKSTGQNIVWLMNGTTYTSYAELIQVPDTNWLIVGTGDFSGDGKTNILWRNRSTGQNIVWLMNGTTLSSYAELMQVTDTNWEIVGTGDFNSDGKTDVLWRNKSTGQNIIWFMNGATYNSYAELMQVPDTNWEIVGPK